jgi:hypothetical protein
VGAAITLSGVLVTIFFGERRTAAASDFDPLPGRDGSRSPVDPAT